ncbi:MAG: hypothetical protein ACNA77_00625 [Opitutales bacterium]
MKRPFFDTSILIAGMIDFGEPSQAPMQILDAVAEKSIREAATAWHCCLEFYSVATRLPEEYRLSPEIAREFVIDEIIGRLGIRTLDAAQRKNFLTDLVRLSIRGGRIYDHHIGTIALQNKTSVIVTENKKHFQTFERTGLCILNAQEFLTNTA